MVVGMRPFRFGAVGGFAPTGQAWTAFARRTEELGYSTLLVPDTLNTFSPFAATAAAAAVTTRLRVGTYVASSPIRTPATVAWEASTLHRLSDGRFELGLGAGRPMGRADAEKLGLEFGTAQQRLARVAETLDLVREVPILMAASSPAALRLAAGRADTVALALAADATEEQLSAKLDELYEIAGDRFGELELMVNLAGVNGVPAWMDPSTAGIGVLSGSVEEMADTLERRRDKLGISYVSVNGQYLEQLAPVVERLAGT